MEAKKRNRLFGPSVSYILLVLVVVSLVGCSNNSSSSNVGVSEANVEDGKELYQANCASCHGADLRGTSKGPSHLSKVYEPGHHSDEGFRLAIKNGAQQHHWNFGNMPAIPRITDSEIDSIISYVRVQQQEQGLE